MRRTILALAVAFAITTLTSAAFANPISGGYSIIGNFDPVNGQTGATTTIGNATGIDFLNLFGSTPSPGTPGGILVTAGSGDFSSLAGATGTIKDFSFAGAGSTNFPLTTILSFENIGGGTVTFDLASVAATCQDQAACPNTLNLSGTGTFNMAGFDPTLGTFLFSGQGAQETFSFSASDGTGGTQSVPEPASIVMLGSGLVGVWARRKRQ